ncbi:MAG: hypothetical protein AVDCRST_MAG19-2212, partial [uncultured Thermomicrobiales bacterium]
VHLLGRSKRRGRRGAHDASLALPSHRFPVAPCPNLVHHTQTPAADRHRGGPV